MDRLFVKIVSCFLGCAFLVTVAFDLLCESPNAVRERERAWCARTLPSIARTAADAFESSGEDALAASLNSVERQYAAQPFFLDGRGRELLRQRLPLAAKTVAEVALREGGFHFSGEPVNAAALCVTGTKAQHYALALLLPAGMFAKPRASPYLMPILFVIGAVFLFTVKRYITSPLLDLGEVAAAASRGRLDARVSSKLLDRDDEIGDLSRHLNQILGDMDCIRRLKATAFN